MRWTRKTKGQAIVEFALMSLLLAMLLAGAVDLGRAYYTAVIVDNMAGEGAAYAAINPDKDSNFRTAGACSEIAVQDYQNIQDRAKKVATDRGLVINGSQAVVEILNSAGTTSTCSSRCVGTTITVRVTYTITDLFLPKLVGMSSIVIRKTASQQLQRSAYAASCGS